MIRVIDSTERSIDENDDAADALRYLVATKSREVRARKLRGGVGTFWVIDALGAALTQL